MGCGTIKHKGCIADRLFQNVILMVIVPKKSARKILKLAAVAALLSILGYCIGISLLSRSLASPEIHRGIEAWIGSLFHARVEVEQIRATPLSVTLTRLKLDHAPFYQVTVDKAILHLSWIHLLRGKAPVDHLELHDGDLTLTGALFPAFSSGLSWDWLDQLWRLDHLQIHPLKITLLDPDDQPLLLLSQATVDMDITSHDPKKPNYSAVLNAPEATCHSLAIENIHLRLQGEEQKLRLSSLTAELYSGKLKADGELRLQPPSLPYTGRADIEGVHIGEWTHNKGHEKASFFGNIETEGNLSSLSHLTGKGAFAIHDIAMAGNAIFDAMSAILDVPGLSSSKYKMIDGSFDIFEKRFHFDEIQSNPDAAEPFTASGTIDFQGNLDLNADLRLRSGVVGAMRMLVKILSLGQIDDIVKIPVHIEGTLKDPKATPGKAQKIDAPPPPSTPPSASASSS